MKKLFLILSVALFALGTVNAFAQEAAAAAETQLAGDSLHHVMMQKFLEGGWAWMLPILIFLIIGLAVAIERILYLSLSTINSKKLITKVEEALKNGGIEAAKEVKAKIGRAARSLRSTTRVSTVTIRVWIRSRRLSFPTVRFRPARWSRVFRGSVCSSLCRRCWASWVPLSA